MWYDIIGPLPASKRNLDKINGYISYYSINTVFENNKTKLDILISMKKKYENAITILEGNKL